MSVQPILIPRPSENHYELSADYVLFYEEVEIVVPVFFRYDGASIPLPAWQLTYPPFHPDVMLPSLIHDWLFYTHQVDRKMTDKIYYSLLRQNGVGVVKARTLWSVVRIFGGLFWKNTDKHLELLVALCQQVRHNPNFERYAFPEEIIRRVDG